MVIKLVKLCPKVARPYVARGTTTLQACYWGHNLVAEPLGYMTPVYGGLLVLTLLAHAIWTEERKPTNG